MSLFQTILGGNYKTPNGEELDFARLKDLQARAKNDKGPCHPAALERCFYYQTKGVEYRMVLGTYKGDKHVWVEYLHKGKWLIDDPAQKIKGWQRKRVSAYSQEALETVPDFRR